MRTSLNTADWIPTDSQGRMLSASFMKSLSLSVQLTAVMGAWLLPYPELQECVPGDI